MINLEKLSNTRFPKKITTEEQNYLDDHYPWTESNKEAITCLRENINSQPICSLERCNNPKYFNPHGRAGYTKGCCKSHTVKITTLERYGVENPGQMESSKKKVKETCMRKYGKTNVFQTAEVKDKSKKTNLEKYGVEYPTQNTEIRQKCIDSTIKHYGVKVPLQNSEILENTKKTNLEKYGVENVSSIPEFRRKAEDTMMKKYGVYHYCQTEDFLEKSKSTCLKKYGVPNHMQDPTIAHKAFVNSRSYKEYIWKTGEISQVQGYEPIVLKELEDKGYNYKTVLTSTEDMPEIWYRFQGKKLRYYPDFYIPSENLIIEVKSDYTLNRNLEINKLKFQAVKDLGFDFRLEVR